MNIQISRHSDSFLYWTAATLLFASCGFADAAIVAWSASLIDSGQFFAGAFSFLLIDAGLFYTAWQMRR